MIQKHELPILEYDSNSEEVIRPNHGAEQLKLPEKCVYAFLGEAVDDYAFEAEATVAETFETITRWTSSSPAVVRKSFRLVLAVF